MVMGLVAGCGGGNAASRLSQAPAYEPKGQTKCSVAQSQSEPLIVEWPSSARAKVEALRNGGVIAVRYSGCELEVLERCSVKDDHYAYTGITPKRDRVTVRDEDSLYANLPLGAAKLSGTLASSGELDVSMTIVGRWAADKKVVSAQDVEGPDCGRATHYVSALTVGAFDFYAGSEAAVGAGASVVGVGAGGSSRAGRTLLDSDGKLESCDRATTADPGPPEGCGGIVRLEVVPIGEATQEKPTCPEGMEWNGSQCVAGAAGVGLAGVGAAGSGGHGEELRFVAGERDQSFIVSVEAGGVTKTCAEPVTYYTPCKLTDLPPGRATLRVGGDAHLERDMKVEDSGHAEVTLSHRGHGAEIGLGITALVSGAAIAYGLVGGFSETDGNAALDIVLVTIGGVFALIAVPGSLGAWLGSHDGAYVQRAGNGSEFLTALRGVQFGVAPARSGSGATMGASIRF